MSGNRTLGNRFERRLVRKLSDMGFWVHLLNQNQYGQPADIIAVRRDKAVLIDAKVCSDGYFRTSRIESNQEASMKMWRLKGNHEWWFALEMPEGDIRMLFGPTACRWASPSIKPQELRMLPTLQKWGEVF